MSLIYLAEPASKTAELIERLAVIAAAHEINELALASIVRAADQMMDVDAAGAHTVKGCVAGLKGNVEDAQRHHSIALQLMPNDLQAHYNYAVTLSLFEQNEEALRVSMEAVSRAPDNSQLLDQAIKVAMASGNFNQAVALCTRWETLMPDDPNKAAGSARLLADKANAGEFSEDRVRELLEIAGSIQRAANIRSVDSLLWPDPEDTSSLVCERRVLATPAEAARMNEELADQIAERADLIEDPGLSFLPMFIGMIS